MNNNIECFHCETDIDVYLKNTGQSVSEWYSDNDLYGPDDSTKEIRCPKCKEKFFVNIQMAPVYYTDIEENYEENND